MLITITPATRGARIWAPASPICVMPPARPKCRLGTSMVVAAVKAGQLKALKLEMIAIST